MPSRAMPVTCMGGCRKRRAGGAGMRPPLFPWRHPGHAASVQETHGCSVASRHVLSKRRVVFESVNLLLETRWRSSNVSLTYICTCMETLVYSSALC
eukprot:355736-Chlamydomonas_euryale.AAC.4